NSKEGDIMHNRSINSIMIILISSLLLSACSMSDWWNGHYATRAALTDTHNEWVAYYAAETPEQRALRRHNQQICDAKYKDADAAYNDCMRRLGTPEWPG
ncbi:hypothetical protein, partial [Eikenella corrodens]|uniref:hypothetical protein n=1 Tax=Eikenella corrodens TaxID=539 RepID=UPI00195BD9DD